MYRTAIGIVAVIGCYVVEITDFGLSREIRIARSEGEREIYYEVTDKPLDECIQRFVSERG